MCKGFEEHFGAKYQAFYELNIENLEFAFLIDTLSFVNEFDIQALNNNFNK